MRLQESVISLGFFITLARSVKLLIKQPVFGSNINLNKVIKGYTQNFESLDSIF